MVELFTAARFARSPRSDRSGSPCRHGTGSPRQYRLNGRVSPESPVADLQPRVRPRTGFKHDGLGRDRSRSPSLSASPASDGCGPACWGTPPSLAKIHRIECCDCLSLPYEGSETLLQQASVELGERLSTQPISTADGATDGESVPLAGWWPVYRVSSCDRRTIKR